MQRIKRLKKPYLTRLTKHLEKMASQAINETMLERSDNYPQGAFDKTPKKVGGVLL